MLRYSLVLLFLGGVLLLATPQVRAQGFQHDFRYCVGDYALCAASTCTPDGKMITVRTATGTAEFPEAQCTCPIFSGPALADVNGGNMEGHCDPPKIVNGEPTADGLWSLYSPMTHIPQAINNWNKGNDKKSAAPIFVCPADLDQGDQFANCFSFACVRAGKVKGDIEVATCFCPLGESLEGTAVRAHKEFATPAGQCNEDICFQHPVGAPFPFDDLDPRQCLQL